MNHANQLTEEIQELKKLVAKLDNLLDGGKS